MLRMPNLALGELERNVLDVLWTHGPSSPGEVHERIGGARGISTNTVASALKRLLDKGLLEREKVSHAYRYRPRVTRAELQRLLIAEIAEQFSEPTGGGLVAAFVDIAQERGGDTLRRLEALVHARLGEDDS